MIIYIFYFMSFNKISKILLYNNNSGTSSHISSENLPDSFNRPLVLLADSILDKIPTLLIGLILGTFSIIFVNKSD
jgi:hypothetical protein